jgi:hypothetical protein
MKAMHIHTMVVSKESMGMDHDRGSQTNPSLWTSFSYDRIIICHHNNSCCGGTFNHSFIFSIPTQKITSDDQRIQETSVGHIRRPDIDWLSTKGHDVMPHHLEHLSVSFHSTNKNMNPILPPPAFEYLQRQKPCVVIHDGTMGMENDGGSRTTPSVRTSFSRTTTSSFAIYTHTVVAPRC